MGSDRQPAVRVNAALDVHPQVGRDLGEVSALMGTNLVLVVFAVVVIGGMGSIMGSIVTGFGLGLIEGLTKVFYPPASNTVIFVVMALVLLIKPAGLFGQTK